MNKSTLVSLIPLMFTLHVRAQDNRSSEVVDMRAVESRSELKPHIGFMAGATQAEGTSQSTSQLGIDVGYQPYIPFGLAAEYSYSRLDDGDEADNRNTLWAKGSYHFGGNTVVIRNSYVGLGLGAVLKTDGTSLAAAPMLGFDIPVVDRGAQGLSLGAMTRYAVVGNDESDTLLLSGVVKFWF